MATSDAPLPFCPSCKHTLDPRTDVLWDHTPVMRLSGITIVYCGWCGAVLGSAPHQTLTKTGRG